ncbi:ABC transporter ATP-binding protein [Thalassoporum mexicanum]|uniref:ABC transporter ATP-binding protein n=1 Tax=Thalassoporum mexicanum TaxID=3457544 RepID=UPI0005A24EA2|nr:ABC transporter ATP-binding protein [Pseudanabaena sp. PCC 7367]
MSEVAISLQNLWKCFKRYEHPADRLKEIFFPKLCKSQEFWAVQGINLEIHKGQTLGIIGRNGSGKSTLLQMIAGTMTPTHGTVEVKGRISALLELGSGFNPEFTGRQNVFFNGRLLGLSKEELEEKFEAIADFADIGDFIDQPVKTYSSGMFVRLAFGVAVNVDPEILIVDEALAVGDVLFQRKCFSKIEELCDRGVTVLFVSHDLNSVLNLCDRAIVLDQGKMLCDEKPHPAVLAYSALVSEREAMEASRHEERAKAKMIAAANKNASNGHAKTNGNNGLNGKGTQKFRHEVNLVKSNHKNQQSGQSGKSSKSSSKNDAIGESRIGMGGAEILTAEIINSDGELTQTVKCGERVSVRSTILFHSDVNQPIAGFKIKTINGIAVIGNSTFGSQKTLPAIAAGTVLTVEFAWNCYLTPGNYTISAGVSELRLDQKIVALDRRQDMLPLTVIGSLYSYGLLAVPVDIDLTYVSTPEAESSLTAEVING